MAFTITRVTEVPIPGHKIQVWRIVTDATAGAFKTGLYNVLGAFSVSQDDTSHGVIKNSSDGTENTQAGSVYLTGTANPATLDILVIGN